MISLAQRTIAEELMDAPDLAPETYQAVLADLEKVNRLTLARRPTLKFLERVVGERQRFSLLDVGCGEGGMLRAIASWARNHGVEAQLTGIDLNPKSRDAAIAQTPDALGIRYQTGDYRECPPCDLVVSNLVAHHMTRGELETFLSFMDANSKLGWFINDLHRHRFAYLGYPLLARMMRWHPIVRHDGQLSIARSYRPAEWPPLLRTAGVDHSSARVFRTFPFRLCVERIR